MASGIQGDSGKRFIVVRLLDAIGTANGIPPDGTAANVLADAPTVTQFFRLDKLGAGYVLPEGCSVRICETGTGTGALTILYARVWLFDAVEAKAFPAGVGADATKGWLNNGAAFGVTSANKLRHSEPLMYVGHADGIQIELGTLGGTTPQFNVDLIIPRFAPR